MPVQGWRGRRHAHACTAQAIARIISGVFAEATSGGYQDVAEGFGETRSSGGPTLGEGLNSNITTLLRMSQESGGARGGVYGCLGRSAPQRVAAALPWHPTLHLVLRLRTRPTKAPGRATRTCTAAPPLLAAAAHTQLRGCARARAGMPDQVVQDIADTLTLQQSTGSIKEIEVWARARLLRPALRRPPRPQQARHSAPRTASCPAVHLQHPRAPRRAPCRAVTPAACRNSCRAPAPPPAGLCG